MGELRLISERQPDADMVEAIETILARVKRGEVLAICFAIHAIGDGTGSQYSIGKGGDVAHLVLAIERVKLRLLEAK